MRVGLFALQRKGDVGAAEGKLSCPGRRLGRRERIPTRIACIRICKATGGTAQGNGFSPRRIASLIVPVTKGKQIVEEAIPDAHNLATIAIEVPGDTSAWFEFPVTVLREAIWNSWVRWKLQASWSVGEYLALSPRIECGLGEMILLMEDLVTPEIGLPSQA